MDVVLQLSEGFRLALQPHYLLYGLTGAFLGTAIGVIPGLGPAGAMAMLLPAVLSLDPTGAIIMLAAIYTGAMYGGSTTSILLRIPGDSAAVVSCLDGYEMARQGRAGPALCIAAIGSFIAGTIGVVGLMLLGPTIAGVAIAFSAPEYSALYLFGLTAVSSLAGESLVKALLAMVFGLMVSTVGQDVMGVQRFTFGYQEMYGGIQILTVVLGLFSISEVMVNAVNLRVDGAAKIMKYRIFIKLSEVLESMGAIFRGGVIGFLIGLLPGAGAGIASFIAYAFERQISKHPERFGTGEIRGVAAPEASNNAASAGAFVPMLALGVPGSASTAVLLAGFMLLNIDPGPFLFIEHPDVVWGLIASLYVGNIFLLILNIPLIGIFVQLLKVPMRLLLPLIAVFSVVGVYSHDGLSISLVFLCAFGAIGYYMREYGFPLAPVILGAVLGGRMEQSFRQAMAMTHGSLTKMLSHPIVILFLLLAILFLVLPRVFNRQEVLVDED